MFTHVLYFSLTFIKVSAFISQNKKFLSTPFNTYKICSKLALFSKLMQSNRPQVKFHLKSDLNLLLIDFLDPITAIRFTRRYHSIQIRARNISKKLIYIENQSKLIEMYQI